MSSQITAIPASTYDDTMSKENRHLADFIPNFWGDIFLSCPSEMEMDARTRQQHEELKQEVRRMLVTTMEKPSQELHLIDAVQRLGVAYHFEKEIEDALQNISHNDCNDIGGDDDLYTSAVRFRLLREHGFNVSCETFNKFKDDKGNFKEFLISDVKGLLELYEAAHFRVHGEYILEEALAFTTSHLLETIVDYPLSKHVANALNRPLRKSLPRLVAKSYISIYEEYDTEDENLLKFAKLDFKILQHLYRKEISEIYRWWKGLDFANNLPFVRDRLVECYLWIVGVYFEPHYSFGRAFTTKVLALTSVVDDIYDAYGTHEELDIFTKAIQRWDINCIDQLPDYMKLCYSALLNVYKEMEDLMIKQGKLYRIELAKEAMKQLCQAYYAEAKWLHENHTPTLEEYLSVTLVSSTYHMLTVASYVGMEDTITKETFIWTFNDPEILRASKIICRLMDDLVTHKFERERKHIFSAVECYIKQYGVSEQVAYDEFNKRIKNAWVDINKAFLKPTAVPEPALVRILNLTKVLDLFYKDGDAYTFISEEVKSSITLLLIDPIQI